MSTILSISPDTERGVYDYVSPSRLALWMRCPRAFALRYIEGVRSETTPALFLGQVVHRVLERFYASKASSAPMHVEHVERAVHDAWRFRREVESHDFGTYEKEMELRGKAQAMLELFVGSAPKGEEPLAVEEAFSEPLFDPRTGEDLGVPLVGIIDLMLAEYDGPRIIDFKTAARSTEPGPLAHELQLTAYAYLVRRRFGRRESGVEIRRLIKTRKPRVTTHRYAPRSDRQIGAFLDLVREYLDALDAGRRHHRPSWQCDTCEHRHRCAAEIGCG